MQISVEVSSEIQREAEVRGIPVPMFVETLLQRGMEVVCDNASVSNAVERIRALRRPDGGGTNHGATRPGENSRR